ncbi:MAG: hypothetical protein AAF968_08460 [Pseudomonadota bacterium]
MDMAAQLDVVNILSMRGLPQASVVAAVCSYLTRIASTGEIGGRPISCRHGLWSDGSGAMRETSSYVLS